MRKHDAIVFRVHKGGDRQLKCRILNEWVDRESAHNWARAAAYLSGVPTLVHDVGEKGPCCTCYSLGENGGVTKDSLPWCQIYRRPRERAITYSMTQTKEGA